MKAVYCISFLLFAAFGALLVNAQEIVEPEYEPDQGECQAAEEEVEVLEPEVETPVPVKKPVKKSSKVVEEIVEVAEETTGCGCPHAKKPEKKPAAVPKCGQQTAPKETKCKQTKTPAVDATVETANTEVKCGKSQKSSRCSSSASPKVASKSSSSAPEKLQKPQKTKQPSKKTEQVVDKRGKQQQKQEQKNTKSKTKK